MEKKKKTKQNKSVSFKTTVANEETIKRNQTENGLSKNQLDDYAKAVKSYNKAKYQFYHAESLKIHKGWSVPELFVKLKDIRLSGKLLNKYGIKFIDNDIYIKHCFFKENTDSKRELNLRKRQSDSRKHENEIKKPRPRYPSRKLLGTKVENRIICSNVKVKRSPIKTEIQPKPKSKLLKKPAKKSFKSTSKKNKKKLSQKLSDSSKTIKKISFSSVHQLLCAECSLTISQTHFSIKKLYCNLCNYNTFCFQAFQLHKQHAHKDLHGLPVLSDLNSLPHKQACVFLSIALGGTTKQRVSNDKPCNENKDDKITYKPSLNDTNFKDNNSNMNSNDINEDDGGNVIRKRKIGRRCSRKNIYYCFCGFVSSTAAAIINHIASCTLHCRIYHQSIVSPTSASHTNFLNLKQSPINEGFMIPPEELTISTSNLHLSSDSPTTIAADVFEDLLDQVFSVKDTVDDVVSTLLRNVEETLMLREQAVEHAKRREKKLKMKERIDAYRLTKPVLRSALSNRRHKESVDRVEEQPPTDLLLCHWPSLAVAPTLDSEDLPTSESTSTALQPREESEVYKDAKKSVVSLDNGDVLNQEVQKTPCISLDGQYELFQQKLKKQQQELDLKLQQQRQEHQQQLQQRKKAAQQDFVEQPTTLQFEDHGRKLPQLNSHNQATVEQQQQGYTEVELLQNIHYQLSQSQNDDSTSFTQPSSFTITSKNPINQNSNMQVLDDRSQAINDAGVFMYDKAVSNNIVSDNVNNDKTIFSDANPLTLNNLITHINPYTYANNSLLHYYNNNNAINTNILQHNQAVTLPK